MRKYLCGFVATLFLVVLAAGPASAESQENTDDYAEPKESLSPVDCTFHLFTQHTVPEHWAFLVGDEIDFEITLSDPDNQVANILFSAGTNNKGGQIQEGLNRQATWIAPAPGQWTIAAQLYDVNGQEIIPTGDCEGAVTVLEMTDPAHPDHPDEVEMPEPTPVDEESSKCGDLNETLTPVPEDDGSVSYYTSDGQYCGTVKAQQPPAAPPAPAAPAVAAASVSAQPAPELAHTGGGAMVLAIGGILLILSGTVLLRTQKKIAVR